MDKLLLIWLAGTNLLLLGVMGWDKLAAIQGRRRIPERTLFSLALLGGSVGGILGMLLFRHKTRKRAFRIGFPAILLCQAALGGLLWYMIRQV